MQEAGNDFSEEAILAGELTPVFFGSALTNFGVQTFLETFLKFAPEPHGHKKTDGELVDPYDKDFSGFVFKIQANMDLVTATGSPLCGSYLANLSVG